VGGDSPIKLIKLPGEPARPPRAQSLFILGAVLADTGVVDKASNMGETAAGLTLSGAAVGLISGVSAGGEEVADVAGLLVMLLFVPLPPALSLSLLLLLSLEFLS
jgi:hypothetical protein